MKSKLLYPRFELELPIPFRIMIIIILISPPEIHLRICMHTTTRLHSVVSCLCIYDYVMKMSSLVFFLKISFIFFSIAEFKECFSFHAKKNIITDVEELSLIMRSLGYSPTRMEVSKYFQKYMNGMINFFFFL